MLSLALSYMLFTDMLRGGRGGRVGEKGGGSGSEGRWQESNWGGAGPENKKLDKTFDSGRQNTHNQQLKQSFLPLNYPYFSVKYSMEDTTDNFLKGIH